MRFDEVLRTCGQTGKLSREEVLFLLGRKDSVETAALLGYVRAGSGYIYTCPEKLLS